MCKTKWDRLELIIKFINSYLKLCLIKFKTFVSFHYRIQVNVIVKEKVLR